MPSGSACSCWRRLAALCPLVKFRWPSREAGAQPARPWHRHPPSSGDRADRHAGVPGSGGAGAVAGAARAHAGLAQAHPRRPAVAAAGDPRSLGAAGAGRGADGGDLRRRRRRAPRASPRRSTGTACWRRPISGSMPGWRRRSTPASRRSSCRPRTRTPRAAGPRRPLPVPAGSTLIVRASGGTLDVVVSGGVTEAAAGRAAACRHQREAFYHRRRRHRPCARAVRTAAVEFRRPARRAPTIALAKDPERQARGSLQMSYKLEDDYGVTEAHARFAARPATRPRTPQRRPRRGRCSTRRNFRWCCRMPGPATASARPSRI